MQETNSEKRRKGKKFNRIVRQWVVERVVEWVVEISRNEGKTKGFDRLVRQWVVETSKIRGISITSLHSKWLSEWLKQAKTREKRGKNEKIRSYFQTLRGWKSRWNFVLTRLVIIHWWKYNSTYKMDYKATIKDVIASVVGSAACVYTGQPFDTIKVRNFLLK